MQLPDGRILVAGGSGREVELFDPSRNRWLVQASLQVGRNLATATLLADGRVLVLGGNEVPPPTSYGRLVEEAEIFDPATGQWTLAAEQPSPRTYHAATRLADGRVLVTGGDIRKGHYDGETDSASIYDPRRNHWQVVPPMAHRREGHTATLLPDGRVMVVGGQDYRERSKGVGGSQMVAAVELFDPKTNRWQEGPRAPFARSGHTITHLVDGQLLAIGGWARDRGSTLLVDRFDPATSQWHEAGELRIGRGDHAATRLKDGRVLLVGGSSNQSGLRAFREHVAEIYDPATDRFSTPTSQPKPRMEHGAFTLPDGRVLVLGGTADHYQKPLGPTEIGQPTGRCAP